MKEAYLYERLEEGKVKCHLCAHECLIREGARGICQVRENKDGRLYSLVYNRVIAARPDPIEKKPLFHFLPGSVSYSIATVGCNFRCKHCQNADISQMPKDNGIIQGRHMSPEDVVKAALDSRSSSISYTYTEPTIYFELALDTSLLAVEKGLKNVFVTNGYMTKECLKKIYPNLHAANVDLKSFSNEFYKDICGARLKPVLDSIKNMKEMDIWVEVTTLLIPGLNDSPKELEEIARFLVEIDSSIPWHVTRFHPDYKLTDRGPTPISTLAMARDIGYGQGLKFVYTGNVPGEKSENTYCPSCNTELIERFGFYVTKNRLKNGSCPTCGENIPGVWA